MLNFHLQLVNSCENDTCSNAIDVPLISKLNAPLKAELDISILTAQLKELIGHKVEASVSKAVKDLIRQEVKLATTNIAKRVNNAVDYLHTSNNITMSTYMQELKETMMKPAFSAFLTKTINLFSRSDILKFDDVHINLGSHYNPKTGKFTAPKSGLYHISYNLMGYEKSTVTFQINKNNEAFVFGYADGSGYATSPSSVRAGHFNSYCTTERADKTQVQASVSKANKGLVENIVDTSVKTAVDNLKTYTNITIAAYKEDLKETTAKTAFFTFLKRSRTFSGSDILKFDDVRINQGNSYNPNTGKFTAPRSGLYHISCSLMGSFSTASIIFQIKKNGELFLNVYAHYSGLTTQSVSLLMELMRGDKIYVKHITSRKELVNGNRQSYFSGFLLQ
ncbi:C1QL [Mytilus coruscus]|uniref:C1QL n=1 Tax=Mytilus coruscus TaxID=42192 RepID=A0A6J8ETL3_MYTCO|nr:C1QL [Mytilus coruscus]